MALSLLSSWTCSAGEFRFQDDFKGSLKPGWSWRREHREGWRITDHGLEIRLEPGNMWGPANNAKNVLVRPAPDPAQGKIEVSAMVENRPTEQYEQVDLVWYYDDGHMVKLGEELVDGKLSIVMGREEKDRTHTISITPLDVFAVQLRLTVEGNRIHGEFRKEGSEGWVKAGETDLPVQGPPRISIQCYQGPAQTAHWAKIKEFQIRQDTD
jgi:regulation of enolase protein 1 (concanavalin A-like superfamily)